MERERWTARRWQWRGRPRRAARDAGRGAARVEPGPGRNGPVLVRAVAAPLVLVAVLASHVSLRASSDLTPWKGGGFGMFSTVDSPASRVVRVELDTDAGRVPVAVPPGLGDLASEATAAPSAGRLTRLAERLGEQRWVVPELAAPDPAGAGGDGGGPALDPALRELALESLRQVVPVDAVQAVAPARFDRARHRPIEVRRVTVAVLRLDTAGDGALLPRPLRAVSLDLARRAGEAAR